MKTHPRAVQYTIVGVLPEMSARLRQIAMQRKLSFNQVIVDELENVPIFPIWSESGLQILPLTKYRRRNAKLIRISGNSIS